MKPSAQNIAIVGAGIAGLAAAIRLQAMGNHVVVFEANDYPGGKLTAFSEKGYRFDMGPSLFTMPQYVEELFGVAKQPMEKYLAIKEKASFVITFLKTVLLFPHWQIQAILRNQLQKYSELKSNHSLIILKEVKRSTISRRVCF